PIRGSSAIWRSFTTVEVANNRKKQMGPSMHQTSQMAPTGVLLVSCADRPGIVAAVASFVAAHGGNVIDLQQHTDHTDGAFFQRVEFELDHFDLDRAGIAAAFAPVAAQFSMRWALRFSDERAHVAILEIG